MTPTDLLRALGYLGPLLVGALVLAAGLAKALFPPPFAMHLMKLGLLPRPLLTPATGLFIGLECALGSALLVRLAPVWLFPATAALLLALAGLAWWATATGRTEDCGCYTNLMRLTPRQSLALSAGCVALMALAWAAALLSGDEGDVRAWQAVAPAAAFATGVLLALASYLVFLRSGRPLLDLGPLRVGRRWPPEGLGVVADGLGRGTHLVVFLKQGCPFCQRLLPALNEAHMRPDRPAVLGVVYAEVPAEEFARHEEVAFPLADAPHAALRRLVAGFPMVLLLEDGVVRDKRIGGGAAALLARLGGR
jgi:thiol-disulfide isomerase/thioredoxin